MIGVSFYRVLSSALRNFQRNIWLSVATTIIMTLTLLTITFLYFGNIIGSHVLRDIEQKVDLSVDFKDSASENQITILAEEIEGRQDVESVRVITSDEALEIFKARNQDDAFIEDSLRELGENPLSTSMYIVATDPKLYETIARHLQSEKYEPFIEKVHYDDQSKSTIENFIAFMGGIRIAGLVATIIFATLVVLIMFNTIRLAIYSFREEIDIMRLVGASRWFIQGPFLVEALLVAVLSVVLTALVVYPTLHAFSDQIEQYFFMGQDFAINLHTHAVNNWVTLLGIQFGSAVVLAVASSYVAIRRYLR